MLITALAAVAAVAAVWVQVDQVQAVAKANLLHLGLTNIHHIHLHIGGSQGSVVRR